MKNEDDFRHPIKDDFLLTLLLALVSAILVGGIYVLKSYGIGADLFASFEDYAYFIVRVLIVLAFIIGTIKVFGSFFIISDYDEWTFGTLVSCAAFTVLLVGGWYYTITTLFLPSS